LKSENDQTHQCHTIAICEESPHHSCGERNSFELVTEVPWDNTTQTPKYNPLEKLPILILEDGTSVYQSHYILEYIETKFPGKIRMVSQDIDERLFAKKVEVVTDGMCDALVLLFFEQQRGSQSKEWRARQMRKVDGGFRTLAEWVGDKTFLVAGTFGLADVAVGSVCGYVDVRLSEYPWRSEYPNLAKYFDQLQERQSFKNTAPVSQKINDKIV
jgi:glutathione S-transferase